MSTDGPIGMRRMAGYEDARLKPIRLLPIGAFPTQAVVDLGQFDLRQFDLGQSGLFRLRPIRLRPVRLRPIFGVHIVCGRLWPIRLGPIGPNRRFCVCACVLCCVSVVCVLWLCVCCGCFKHHQNSTKGPRSERRKKENCGGRGKKSAKCWAPHHPSGRHPSGPHPCMNCVCPPRKWGGGGILAQVEQISMIFLA